MRETGSGEAKVSGREREDGKERDCGKVNERGGEGGQERSR
jgi:hypothetical protein